jgi:electron transfer flavoprotein alpha subunit
MTRIFVYIAHKSGAAEDSAAELLAASRLIDPAGFPTALVAGSRNDNDLESVCESLRTSFAEVWKITHGSLDHPDAEILCSALPKLLPPNSIVLIPHDHFGIDLAPGLSIKLNASFISDILEISNVEGRSLTCVRQEFGGQVSAHVRCDIPTGAVITVRPGAFKAIATSPANGSVIDKFVDIGSFIPRRRYLQTLIAEAGDVDITKHNILVSIGRGIQEKENVEIAQELADVLGAAVSCSRPVVDAKWLEKSRQVGSSGKTVKPKVYLACGISGAFQHLAGIKGKPFIIAINKNPKAPIFQVADVGVVDDLLEFLPELTNKIRETQSVSAK